MPIRELRGTRRAAVGIGVVLLEMVAGVARGAPAPAHVRKGPYVTWLAATGGEVRFELDRPAGASIELTRDGAPAGSAHLVAGRGASDMHVIALDGLEPDARYRYVVRLDGAPAAQGRFVTAPAPDAATPLRFQVYGDNRSDPAAHAAVVQALRDAAGEFLVNTGDLVSEGGNAGDWQTFFDIEAPLLAERPVFAVVGNHELVDDAAGANFVRYFGPSDPGGAGRLHATTRVGIVRFFFLNAMDDWSSGEEREWLERELAKADGEPGLVWRIAVLHHSPWSAGPHGPNTRFVEARIPELLTVHGVDLLFAGHDHIYDRGDSGGIKYIVSGGGGAPLYRIERADPTARKAEAAYHFVSVDLTPTELRIVAIRVDGSVLDRCGFAKGAAWDCDPPRPASGAAFQPDTAANASPPNRGMRCGCSVVGIAGATPVSPAVLLLFGADVALRRRRRRGAPVRRVRRP